MKLKLLIIILLMGLCYYDIAFIFSFEKIYPEEKEISFLCEIIKEKEEKDYYDKYIVKVIENCELDKSRNTKLILYLKKDNKYNVGDILKIKGNFEKAEIARNYKGFNYRRYLKQNKIYGIVFAQNIQYVKQRKDLYFILAKIRNSIENKINILYKDEYAHFLGSLLIGDKSELNDEIIENFQNSSVSHILAISGLHISFIVYGLKVILEKTLKSKKIKECLITGFLIVFLFITGKSVSCTRVVIMNIYSLFASLLYRKNNFYINFILSLIFIIVLNPYNIFSVGMWLSFAGTLGIVIVDNLLYKVLKKRIRRKLKNELKFDFILKNFCITVSAQILIFPITIYVFNSYSINFFLSNIIISFFIGYIIAIGYISVFISYIFYPFSKILSYLETNIINIIFVITGFISKLPLSKIYVKTPNLNIIIFYYFIFILFLFMFKRNKMHILKILISKKIKFSNIIKLNKLVLNKILIIFVICVIITNYNIPNLKLNIFFIDVGQGDSTLIVTPSGKRIIIDGGEGNSEKYDYGKNVLFPYLLDRKINEIDYLIISHADSDHIGGLIYILENMKVKKILIGVQPEISDQLQDFVSIANKKKVKIITLKKGDEIEIDKNIKIDVLWPDNNNLIYENILNNNSLVFKLIYNNFSMLFTGDIEKIAEEKITKIYSDKILNSNIIKLPHHGSKTSSISNFIDEVNPQIALIGVGKNNKFGHPSNEVINRLEKRNIKIYRTDQMGEISITVNSKGKVSIKKFIE